MSIQDIIISIYTKFKGGKLFRIAHWITYWAHHVTRLKMRVLYALTGNVYMFYLEVIATSRCTLKCRDCIGDIPEINADEQYSMSFAEYKYYLDNLLRNIKELKMVRIMGGEPLLNKDIEKIMEYTLEQNNIKQVYLVTNATIMLSDKLVEILRKYPKKAIAYISNYSVNKDLQSRLKIKEILAVCSQNNITVNHPESHQWNPRTPAAYHERSVKENKKYFRACAAYCVGMHKLPDGGAALFPCIRAGTLSTRKIGSQTAGKDYVRLDNNLQKKDIVRFHANADFDACRYCNFLEDKNKQVAPGIQNDSPTA